MAAIAPQRTNTIQGELHQIQAHVESTNIRIQFLEHLLESPTNEQFRRIQAGLMRALRNLEHLQQRVRPALPEVEQVRKDVARAYRRLKRLEQRLWEIQHEDPRPRGSFERSKPFRETGGENAEQLIPEAIQPLRVERRNGTPDSESQHAARKDTYVMNGAMNSLESPMRSHHRPSESSETRRSSPGKHTNGLYASDEDSEDAVVEMAEAVPILDRRHVRFPTNLPKLRSEVMASLLEEEFLGSLRSIREPDRVRTGSTSGWHCSQEIMCGVEDFRCIRPKLAFFKIFEVKALKTWLLEQGYLKRSLGISRTEKVLHLIFALQDGVRFEILAVLFSRSPRQVERTCTEVFNGILEMHSETMLPTANHRPLYDHLWKIIDRYATVGLANQAKNYYPWEAEDLYKVLVTLNFYIGRWRKQGQFALDGPFLDWGRYVQTGDS